MRVDSGQVQGVVGDGVVSYKGIPFAAPPGPQPLAPAPTVASLAGDTRCEQVRRGLCAGGIPSRRRNDVADILGRLPFYQSLATCCSRSGGKAARDGVDLRRWVYGRFKRHAHHSGIQFAKQGVILVAMNYRVGRFGFFAFPALARNVLNENKGNYAYMDQIAALHWVQTEHCCIWG